jgi:serine protease AprX
LPGTADTHDEVDIGAQQFADRDLAGRRPTARPMTVSFGWSIDFTGPRRAALVLLLALATSILGQAAFAATTRAGGYDPASDPNSMFNVTSALGAQDWWRAGYTGAGVDIALIDTGCAPVPGLDAPGKLVFGPDLSLESQAANLAGLDTNGHGTFMASLIAGNDAGSGAASPAPWTYRGIAPDARILCIKVGSADGGTDVSQVIAAIDWVVQHQYDGGLNIRVLNLSYGTNSTQSYTVDPLAFAAEQAWKRGIVVVAAAGNSGYQKGKGAPGLASPAYDPYLIAVGATTRSSHGKKAKDAHEQMATYSASGAGRGGCRNPDLVAPGSHLQGLRVPGSFVDLSTPPGLIDTRYQRGSGTSEATALVSGSAALLLQKWPSASPDQIKKLLTSDTEKIPGADDKAQGKGRLDLARLLDKRLDGSFQRFAQGTGTGSLEVSRGDDHLTRDGVVLQGEIDIFGHAFDASSMAMLEAAGASWTGGSWNGSTWTGNSWSGNSWSGNSWSGNSWSGNSWSGNSWSGNSWSGNSWSGNSWSGNSWSGNSWSGNSWSGNSWSGNSWSGDSWQ